MNLLLDRIEALRVRDIMAKTVISVSPCQSMADVATLFHERGITVAPVVDDEGVCVGVISATDFVRREALYAQADGEPHELVTQEDGTSCLEPRSAELVADCMSPAVQSIAADARLVKAARIMSDGHLHGLPVVEDHRPIGFVSNIDVVAALVNAVDEARM